MEKADPKDGAVALAEVLRDPCLHSNHVRKERGGGEGKQALEPAPSTRRLHQASGMFPRSENRFLQRLLCVRVHLGLFTKNPKIYI